MRHLYLLAAAAAGQPTRIWIDADCDGFHDAAAISQLSKYNVIGASAVFGSATVVEAQQKCADILRQANIDVEVTAGAAHYDCYLCFYRNSLLSTTRRTCAYGNISVYVKWPFKVDS